MKTHRRNTFWFGKYDWCVRFHLPEAFVLRKLDHEYIDHVIKRRRDWAIRIANRSPQPGSWMHSWSKVEITDEQVENLHRFCDFLLGDNRARKMTITGDWIYLYTTDRALVNDILKLDYLDGPKGVHQALQVGTPNTVRLREAHNQFRTYFRHVSIDSQQKTALLKFLQAQENLRIGPALLAALIDVKTKRLFDYYFVDHDESGVVTMLNLIVPGTVRRTVPIVADK